MLLLIHIKLVKFKIVWLARILEIELLKDGGSTSRKDNTTYNLELRKYPPSHAPMRGQFKVCAWSLFFSICFSSHAHFFIFVLGTCLVYCLLFLFYTEFLIEWIWCDAIVQFNLIQMFSHRSLKTSYTWWSVKPQHLTRAQQWMKY
jgi:hypothetical protein